MNIISIETATDWCGVALLINDKCEDKIQKKIPRKHSEKLPVYYNRLMLSTKFDDNKLDAIAVSIGPGSFTGLRIGLGFAKGLAFAKDIPIIPVPTLDVIARSSEEENDDFSVYLFSHSDIVYHQQYKKGKAINSAKASRWSSINKDSYSVHYGCEELLKSKRNLSVFPRVETVGRLAIENCEAWVVKIPYSLVPNYISPFNVR
ncbi:MAG: tRNA (adenosine(37)-N6)-threonylcarbamoyltransferase complex dimerization subunit type 1 TsaB [Candidatus Neomarinimicrobiota bacterium]|jgi:tRNA threonylcarbamoyladenosine biosynthesis protein TsaB|nr:tRNA (adenosine(37)-N6)-threonylcarbamoyltransferase complex dimerization subunit type 1 TsaB [Candidatus Neomarinimicrobiota bacterium]